MAEMERADAVFRDAWTLYEDAIEELRRRKIRNAAEKAWGATKRATDGLILARTGTIPETAARTTRGIHTVASQDGGSGHLSDPYHARADFLHGNCFYDGLCEPEVERYIRETADYIRDAEQVAQDR